MHEVFKNFKYIEINNQTNKLNNLNRLQSNNLKIGKKYIFCYDTFNV